MPLPDAIIRAAIHRLCSRTATRLATGNAESDAWFADEMAARAIAEYADEANAQHYEVPAAFFAHVLGPNRKYSSCFYKELGSRRCRRPKRRRCAQTVEHADISPMDNRSSNSAAAGARCRCGWRGNFRMRRSSAVSNSNSQREYIESEAAKARPDNLRVVTSDMNVFDAGASSSTASCRSKCSST